jgi:hypothetical protein
MDHMPVDNHGPCLRNMEAADSGVILTHEHNSETMADTLQMNKVGRAVPEGLYSPLSFSWCSTPTCRLQPSRRTTSPLHTRTASST